MKLYGIRVDYNYRFEIEEREVVKETPKCYKLNEYMPSMGCRTQIHKGDPGVALTKIDAIKKYKLKIDMRIKNIKESLARAEERALKFNQFIASL